MDTKKEATPKTVKVSVKIHSRLAKAVKLKTDSFNDIIGRALTVYESLPEIRSKIDALYSQMLNACRGNTERTEELKQQRAEFMAWLRGKENE